METPTSDRIVRDPTIMVGKPTIRGTRISVEAVLNGLAAGASADEVLADYPLISREDVLACVRYAAGQTANSPAGVR